MCRNGLTFCGKENIISTTQPIKAIGNKKGDREMKHKRRPDPVAYSNLREIVLHAAEHFPDTRFFLGQDAAMPFVTGRELKALCGAFGAWTQRRSLHGEHIAILGRNGAAWLSCFFAVICSGCVVVPLHLGTKPDELISCLERSDSAALLYDESCSEDAAALRSALPELETVSFSDLIGQLRREKDRAFPQLHPDDLAALYFTSGTTARSRCVMLTHRNLGSQCSAAMSVLPLSAADSGLSILPPSHTFELVTNIVGALHCGGTMYINESLLTVKENLRRLQPSIIVCVPLVLQTLAKEIRRTAKKQGRLELLEKGMRLNGFLSRFGIDLSRRLFSEVYDVVGHNLRYFLCGGAALDPALVEFFRRLGITVLQGYGITECSPIVAANLPSANRFGSIGRTFPSCETKLVDGEICVRGDSVSPGYYRDPEATAEAYREGWFHTGDLGRIDRDGYLYFLGRRKNLIVLSNGENVSPERLEEKLYRVEGVVDAVVYEANGKITAEVYADAAVLPDRNAVWQKIDRVNSTLAQHEQIGALVLRDAPFEKTVTQKIKRYHEQEA